MNREREDIAVGGRSFIALLMPHQAGQVDEGATNFALEQFQLFREDVPDLRFIFWSGGSENRFERFVREPARDLFPLRINLQGSGSDSIQSKLTYIKFTIRFAFIHSYEIHFFKLLLFLLFIVFNKSPEE